VSRGILQRIGLPAGPLLALVFYVALPEGYTTAAGEWVVPEHPARATMAIALWMAIWWLSEAIPIYATALLPLAVLPLSGAATIREAARPYGHELIFLFMGGFIIALAMQRWGLHRRMALRALSLVGTNPRSTVGGFMLVTALLSMWVSNTATVVMMLPIAISVITLAQRAERDAEGNEGGNQEWDGASPLPAGETRNFALCLLLGIAYGASIGGIGTLIGTPPNLFLASFAKSELGREISFVGWMAVGLPLVAVFLPGVWWGLTRWLYPVRGRGAAGSGSYTREALAELGPMQAGEWVTLAVFATTACTWILRPLLNDWEVAGLRPLAGLTDTGIAVIAALSLFVIRVDRKDRVFAMDWETAVQLPWGVLILFGGGLSLAAAIQANGVGEHIGNQLGALAGWPVLLLMAGVTMVVIFLTELTSNTATTATFVPILAALAPSLDLSPYVLIVPATIAASCAFMLPVATPPNAIVFGSGTLTVPEMSRAGFWFNLLGIVLITALTYAVALPLLTGGAAR
jgi:sodium-dependent dicarboxylate transporter 2/3/5